jgi:hypothetical protein
MKNHSHRLPSLGVLLLAPLLCLVGVLFPVLAQIDVNEKWATGKYEAWYLNYKRYSKADVLAAQEKWRLLEADDDAGEWAGYYSPLCDFCEVSLDKLRWSPKSGFLEIYVYTCVPELRALNFGSAVESPTAVHLIPQYPAATGRSVQPAKQYLKVKWGERHYLIAENEVAEFCEQIAGVGVRAENQPLVAGDFYLKDADWEKPVTGLPTLPKGYRHLLKKPIDAKIIAIGKSYVEYNYEDGCGKRTVAPFTIDAGSANGVKVGMIFKSLTEDGPVEFRVTSVSKHSSRAVSADYGWQLCDEENQEAREEQTAGEQKQETDEEKKEPELKVGLQLSTSVIP